jgi:hypothetical protein
MATTQFRYIDFFEFRRPMVDDEIAVEGIGWPMPAGRASLLDGSAVTTTVTGITPSGRVEVTTVDGQKMYYPGRPLWVAEDAPRVFEVQIPRGRAGADVALRGGWYTTRQAAARLSVFGARVVPVTAPV